MALTVTTGLSTDALLDRFVEHATTTGLSLYPAQEEAVLELLSGKHVVLATPTGSGKSLVAEALHYFALCQGRTSFYTCPIKALVNEKFFVLCKLFGPDNVGLMTGDGAVNRNAPIICCTAEILSNLCLRESRHFVDDVVMDEFHYYGDKERGVAWQVPLLALPDTRFLLMSATLGDLSTITESLKNITGREIAEVRSTERPVPLTFTYAETALHETVQKLLEGGKAPVYLVNFTQRAAAEQAQNLLSIDFSTKADKELIKETLHGVRFDSPFGKDLKRLLLHGVGLHHAGLLPKYRLLVEKLSQRGLLKVISGTDTLGVGVNVPIRTVLLTQLCKFDGEKTALLTARDFQQISGRAGRRGFDTRGDVVAQAPEHVIENLKLQQKKAQGKKVVLQKPPDKGFVHYDAKTFEQLQTRAPEPLESRFTISHGFLIHLLASHAEVRGGGYRKLVELIARSHGSTVIKNRLRKQAAVYCRSLIKAGIVQHERGTATMPAHLHVAEGLQHDFSLNHTLSLYLHEILKQLDRSSETFALDVLSLVESILENPDVVLYAQLNKLKGQKIAELKAQGMEYDQRMEELEKLEWPKPLREFIYGTFNDFAAAHPWVGQENIRPKSVARELFEGAYSFNEYIKEYGLQRSEGVVLRYLTDAYKTLLQNVPEVLRDEKLDDVIAFLDTTLRRVDASLLEEWERLRSGDTNQPAASSTATEPEKTPVSLRWLKDPKALAAKVRSEMHLLVRALARRDFEVASEQLDDAEHWPPAKLEAAMAPFWGPHGELDVTPRSRTPLQTHLAKGEADEWTVRQTLLGTAGTDECFIEGTLKPSLEQGLGFRLTRIHVE